MIKLCLHVADILSFKVCSEAERWSVDVQSYVVKDLQFWIYCCQIFLFFSQDTCVHAWRALTVVNGKQRVLQSALLLESSFAKSWCFLLSECVILKAHTHTKTRGVKIGAGPCGLRRNGVKMKFQIKCFVYKNNKKQTAAGFHHWRANWNKF